MGIVESQKKGMVKICSCAFSYGKGSRRNTQTNGEYLNVILRPGYILYNTAYVPNSNMATSATVSVYCTAIKKCHLSIYHDHYTAK